MSTRADLQFMRRRTRSASAVAADQPATSAGQRTGADTGSPTGGSAAVADFLRGRSARRPAPAAAQQADARPAAESGSAAVGDFLRGRSARPGRAPAAEPAPATPQPAASSPGSSLDLDGSSGAAPEAPAESEAPAASAGNPLDLGTSGAPKVSGRGAVGSAREPRANPLDLDAPAGASPGVQPAQPVRDSAVAPAAASPTGRHRRLVRHDLALPGITAGERRRMDAFDPVVHLTRAQSAFGSLEVQAAVPQGAHLTLGAAFEVGGREGVVLPTLRNMGPDQRSPTFRVSSGGLVVNLRQITAVDRFLIYAVLSQEDKRMPGGTVVVTTYGGARLELPLTSKPTYGAQALLSAYVVEGRIVLRAEHDPFSRTLHQVCDAYGFRELTWRDPFTPLV